MKPSGSAGEPRSGTALSVDTGMEATLAGELEQQLEHLTRDFAAQAPGDVIALMADAMAALADTGIAGKALTIGDAMPHFTLPDATGQTVDSRALLEKGPLIVTFYRGEWCPYCNLQLAALQRHLPAIAEHGTTLVAIAPTLPDESMNMRQKLNLAFPVLSDVGNAVARQFGLVYALDNRLRPIYAAFGVDLPARNGDDSWELPLAATYVVTRDGIIAHSFLTADYRRRLEPALLLRWLGDL